MLKNKAALLIAVFTTSSIFLLGTAAIAADSETQIQFVTTDLDGNSVTSEELFADNEITMVTCWGLWSPDCMEEMEELSQIHTRLQEKGCGIVGLEFEKEEEMYQKAKEKLQSYEVSFPNALLPEEMLEKVSDYPTAFFVDKEGTILHSKIEGARIDEYEDILDELLSQRKDASAETEMEAFSGIGANITAEYQIHVADDAGPVEGVMIQFCNDTTCFLQETDADGIAFFEAPEGKDYEVHVVEVPESYQEDEEVYTMPEDSFEMSISLQKASEAD